MVFVTTHTYGKEAIAMRFNHSAATRQQFRFLQRQFLQEGDLPFSNVLTNECLAQALNSITTAWKDRVYTPLVTLWVFLGQVLSADHSCRAAVARLIAHRLSQGLSPCSPETGAYCQARKRLHALRPRGESGRHWGDSAATGSTIQIPAGLPARGREPAALTFAARQ